MNSCWEAEQWRCDGNTEFQERNWVAGRQALGHCLSWEGGCYDREGGKRARTGARTVDVRKLRDANGTATWLTQVVRQPACAAFLSMQKI